MSGRARGRGRASDQSAGRGTAGRGVSRGRSKPMGQAPPPKPNQDVEEEASGLSLTEVQQKILPVSGQFDNAEPSPVPVNLPSNPPENAASGPAPTQTPVSTLADDFTELVVTSKPSQPAQPPQQMTTYLNEKFPKKPASGTLGRPIMLRTNHYKIKMPKEITVHQYDIDLRKVHDKLDREVKNKDIYKALFTEIERRLGAKYKNKLIYNFRKNLFSLIALPFDEKSEVIKIENSDYSLKIKKINVVTLENFEDAAAIQVLDLIFTHNFNFNCFNVRRSFFRDDCYREAISFDTEVWKGVFASVRPSEIGLTLNLDSANAAFLYADDVLALAFDFYEIRDKDPVQLKKAIENDRSKYQSGIGCKFMDMFRGREIKTSNGFRKKIQGFGPDSSYKFEITDPKGVKSKISIADYYKKQYGIVIKHPNLPCIETGKSAYVPMELCRIEARNKKTLTPDETAKMIRVTATPALDRQKDIQTWAQTSGIANDPILKEYAISVDLKMLDVLGRVLPAPDVEYSKKVVNDIGKTDRTMGQWNHAGFQFLRGMTLTTWVVLNFSTRVRNNKAFEFTEKLRQIGSSHGMKISVCKDYFESRSSSDRDAQALFEEAVKAYKDLELILVILPGGDGNSAYRVCKTMGDLRYGVVTQAVEDRNVNIIKDMNLSNILLKINTKLGGTNFYLSQINPLFVKYLQELYRGPMMVFGADVTHPSPGDTKITESIAAVVGSLDKECSYYAARLYAQKSPRGQAFEMIHHLDEMVKSLLEEYYARNKQFPKKIVFYRDGVSEGQFPIVIRDEMNKIREACQQISPGYKPAITFIVVQKRHHTRFFPTRREDQVGKAQNVPPGTVVDKTIVTPSLFDFFLCSHFGIQGTSRPCRYFVLHDDSNFSMDQVQILSYYLCHIYSRCPRSVSYPAPAYYSHLAAFRGRDYNRPSPSVRPNAYGVTSYEIKLHENIKNKMFFT